jgi:hypothetical protein
MSRSRRFATACLLSLLSACGGGGGGGGGAISGGKGPPADGAVAFTGFSFLSGSGVESAVPPMENGTSIPPSVGAGLNTVVVFHFDGVPAAPFSQASLPVFTTPADVTEEAGVPGTLATLPAKGTYHLVVDAAVDLFTVEFRPFVPTGDVTVAYDGPAETVPGLLPASVYTAQVSTVPGVAIGNLQGAGGLVSFGTTSNPAAFFPADPSADEPPSVVLVDEGGALVTTPADGATDFFPGTFAKAALDSVAETFPDGPADILLAYDHPLLPASSNVAGSDLDGDGVVEPTFFFSTEATELLIGHLVPGASVAGGGAHAPFAAVSGYVAGQAGDVTGSEVIFHNSVDGGLPGPSLGLASEVKALAVGRDASLLYTILDMPGADLLTVGDYLLGDPAFGALGTDSLGGAEVTLSTGLDDLVGLLELQCGRLVAFDRTTRRVVELVVELERHRPAPGKPTADAPVLLSLTHGAQEAGELFLSEEWPAGIEVHDLAQAPSGGLYAVGTLPGSTFPSLVKLPLIDPDLDGTFEAGEGAWSGSTADAVLAFSGQVESVEFSGEEELLVLDRLADALQRVFLDGSPPELIVSDVAGYDAPLPGGLSPARTLACGRMELELSAVMTANAPEGATISVTPLGVLPIGAALDLMQRNVLTTLAGVSELNADSSVVVSPMGAQRLLTVTTATPIGDPGGPVDDAFHEDFIDTLFEDGQPDSVEPLAEWAAAIPGFGVSGGLRAFVGASETAQLGDFVPVTHPDWDSTKAYLRESPSNGEMSLELTNTPHTIILLDTDAQIFPLTNGSTPGVTEQRTIFGGHFVFRDFIIPAGVHVIARGSHPLRITATGTVQIDGMLDLTGADGFEDDTFDSGFLPGPGGPGGPGGGRGGDGHPTVFDPTGTGAIDQYATPEAGERGWGPVVGSTGNVSFLPIGGYGGVSTAGYNPFGNGFPKVPNAENSEHHRPPGGGGGSFFTRGDQAHEGTGVYLVQSNSTWFPFSKCAGQDDHFTVTQYGNDENLVRGVPNATPLQCVYMVGTPQEPERYKPGGAGGDLVFTDGDPENDYIGPGGELEVLIGGQGGGGGGSRLDSLRKGSWAANGKGDPSMPPPLPPPHYPKLFTGIYLSPTLWDAKGAGGGGGAGSVQIRSYGDIVLGRYGHIEARGGHGGGTEVVQNSAFAGGGGGGSGGAVLLQAAGDIRMEADLGHKAASYYEASGLNGASIDVSGGMGRDAITDPRNKLTFSIFSFEATRGDAGQGGMGLVQLQSGGGMGLPVIEEGAHVFAKKRATLKLGKWTGDSLLQEWHDQWVNPSGDQPPDDLRMIDMLHYRYFKPDPTRIDRHYILNGTHPPIIPSTTGDNGHDIIHEYPEGSGKYWFDTKMIANEMTGGLLVVQEPQPEKVMETYLGWNPVTFKEPFWKQGPPPGTIYDADDEVPFSIRLNEPDGTPVMIEKDGVMVVDPEVMVDRLPLIHPGKLTAPLGTVSQGTSEWLDFNGVALRTRDPSGRTPPYFHGVQGTFNVAAGVSIPAGTEGFVRTGAPVPVGNIPAHFVVDSGPDDPGLFPGRDVGQGDPPNPPHNDIKVDAPDDGIGMNDVVTDNATVSLLFQGAYAIRPGSHVPDTDSLSSWVADVTELDGFPLVRFRVIFDLGANVQYPFGVDSYRPSVDYVRLRASY